MQTLPTIYILDLIPLSNSSLYETRFLENVFEPNPYSTL